MHVSEDDVMETATGVVGGVVAGSIGYLAASGLDRYLATWDPSSSDPPPPDKFTSSGSGALANSLNVSASPGPARIAAGIGMVALPAVGAAVAEDSFLRGTAEFLAIGAGVNFLKLVVTNVVLPMLVGKDTSEATLKKSYIARLYPAEVAASINKKAAMTSVSAAGAGVLSDDSPYQTQHHLLTAGLHGDSPYATVHQALTAGLHGDSPYATTDQALRAGLSGDSPYRTAAQDLLYRAGLSEAPVADTVHAVTQAVAAAVPGVHPDDAAEIAGHVVANPAATSEVVARTLPHLTDAQVHEVSRRVHAEATQWQPGAASQVGPGPQAQDSCGCVGDPTIGYASFLGEPEREDDLPLGWRVH